MRVILEKLQSRGFDSSYITGDREANDYVEGCSQCQAVAVNGVACHEHGCPNQTHECAECGEIYLCREHCRSFGPHYTGQCTHV